MREQNLAITYGGFIEGHPEAGTLHAVCGTTDYTRNELGCDIYNGLRQWNITEVSVLVVWAPYGERDQRLYRVPVSIAPLTTVHESFRLGLQLPADDRIIARNGRTLRPFQPLELDVRPCKGLPHPVRFRVGQSLLGSLKVNARIVIDKIQGE